MRDFPFASFIFVGVLITVMSGLMHFSWGFNGMAGVFAVIAAISFCNVVAAEDHIPAHK